MRAFVGPPGLAAASRRWLTGDAWVAAPAQSQLHPALRSRRTRTPAVTARAARDRGGAGAGDRRERSGPISGAAAAAAAAEEDENDDKCEGDEEGDDHGDKDVARPSRDNGAPTSDVTISISAAARLRPVAPGPPSPIGPRAAGTPATSYPREAPDDAEQHEFFPEDNVTACDRGSEINGERPPLNLTEATFATGSKCVDLGREEAAAVIGDEEDDDEVEGNCDDDDDSHDDDDDDDDEYDDMNERDSKEDKEDRDGAEFEDIVPLLSSASLKEYAEQRAAGLIARRDYNSDNEFTDAWALAVRKSKAFELRNQYSRVGILLDANFPDFEPAPNCEARLEEASLEQVSLAKARMVYETTGLPAIAETHELIIDPPESGSRVHKTMQQGYKTRKVYEEADAMIDRVRPISDENRVTRFRCVAAYYDGEMEILSQGGTEVAIVFSAARYITVAIASALDHLYIELTRVFRLKLVPPGGPLSRDGETNGEKALLVGATLLRERIIREGEMLDNSILKVSSFLNHKVDVELMESCGEELAERLRRTAPTKVLTVESTGLIPGLPTARKLGIPLVFARKSRPITVSDSFQTTYRSATKGTTSELVVSCEYLTPGDRVVIIDDFLAGGSTAEALFKLARMAHAKVVGVGVLIEKITDGGRAFLSGYDVPVESLAKVLPSSDTGRVEVVDEEPWVSPDQLVVEKVEVTSGRLRAARRTAARRVRGLDSENDDFNGAPRELRNGSDSDRSGVPQASASGTDYFDNSYAAGNDEEGSMGDDADLDDDDDFNIVELDEDDDYDEYDRLQDSLE